MSEFRVRLNPTNPGHFFACCGLLELADRMCRGAEGFFEKNSFVVRTKLPLETVIRALISRPAKEVTRLDGGVDVKPLIAPLRITLRDEPKVTLLLDAWMTVRIEKGSPVAEANPPWNFWSGQQTSHRIWTSLREALNNQINSGLSVFSEHIFEQRVALSGRFGFDPGAAWNALDAGFSPNEHKEIGVASSPAVELLAAVGIQRFRPRVSEDRETFIYSTWTPSLTPAVALAAASGLLPVGEGVSFLGRVVSRGSYAALGYSTPIQ